MSASIHVRPVLQAEGTEGALACLALVASAHGVLVDLHELRRRFPVSRQGTEPSQLIAQAAELGIAAQCVKLEVDDLPTLRMPAILHWDSNRFVVLKKASRRSVVIFDPAVGERRLSAGQASAHFAGIALEPSATRACRPGDLAARLGARQLTGKFPGVNRSVAQLLALALLLQLLVVAGPLLNRKVIDDVLVSADHSLLAVLLAGFGALLLAQTAVAALRSWMATLLGQAMFLRWAGSLFAHLVRLPMGYFEKRHASDIGSRFRSVTRVRRTLTTSALEAVLDGCVAVLAFVGMMLHAPALAGIVLAAVAVCALLRWAADAPMRSAAAERLMLSDREQSHFLETLSAITPMRLFGREAQRWARWHHLLGDVHQRDLRISRLNITLATAGTLVFGIENLLVLWLGARSVVSPPVAAAAPFTLGMLFAFLAYKAQFSRQVVALIDHVASLRMLSLHADRISDIALHDPEPEVAPADLAHLSPRIELRDVGFRHADGEPWVLRHVSVTIEPGDHVAVTGGSGAGKTTLMKILLGLLSPTEGEVLYGGSPMHELGLANVRRQYGAVMQDDVLLAGSLADNIAFFDPQPDASRLEAAARVAQIHEHITRLPIGYHTVVGDLGRGLSAGQRQRLLLARALYRRPRVLMLDEPTSQLDAPGERAIAEALMHLPMTRIVIAHRPGTTAGAQRLLELHDGRLHEPFAAVVDDDHVAVQLQGA